MLNADRRQAVYQWRLFQPIRRGSLWKIPIVDVPAYGAGSFFFFFFFRIVNYAGILAETTVPSQSREGKPWVKRPGPMCDHGVL